MTLFSSNLTFLMHRYETTQQKIASFAGVSQNAVSHWVNGTASPKVAGLVKLHQFFGLSLDIFLMVDLTRTRIDLSNQIADFKLNGFVNPKNVFRSGKGVNAGPANLVITLSPKVMAQVKELNQTLGTLIGKKK